MLFAIVSSAFSKITAIYHFRGIELPHSGPPRFRRLSQAERAKEATRHRQVFKVLREAHKVRSFKSKLRACLWDFVGEEPVRILEEGKSEEGIL